MRVAVCITSYRRPEGLRRLLEGLNGLVLNRVRPSSVRIIVVDNDPEGSASVLCEEMRPNLRWPIEYHIELKRGISQARNTAVALAVRDSDSMAFIDDDEVPEPLWLDELLHVQRSYEADVVCGPVLPYFYEPVPAWVVKGKFFEQAFERPRYPTGHLLELAATNNVLMRVEMLKKMTKLFDERLGLTGGEDVDFFARVYRAGYKIVWSDDALVREWTPRSRTNAKWILLRSFRLGYAASLHEMYSGSGVSTKVVRIAKGVGRILQGLVLVPLSIPLSFFQGLHKLVKPLQYVCRGIGMLAGLVGVRYEEYR